MYLASKNADIEKHENPINSRKNNRHSEPIPIWNVGYKVAKEYNKKFNSSNIQKEGEEHSRPRMHYRRAHWHTFKCGKGRKEERVKFLPQTEVNYKNKDALPAVAHKVK